jgi:branched-chain amino acid transport system substrate-binding protein
MEVFFMLIENGRPLSTGRRKALGWMAALAGNAAWAMNALANNPLVVGQVAPFSGPQAVTGKAIHAGIKLCFDAVNARGGINGRPLKLVTRDDGQRPEDTVRLTKELIAVESPVALIGTIGTANLEALHKDGALLPARLSMVGAISGANSIVQASNIHVVKASYHDEVEQLFKQLASNGLKRVGLAFQDDAFGRDVIAGADAAARKHGIDMAVRSGYPRNTVAVEKAVSELAAANVQAVLLAATTVPAIAFVRQYKAAGGKGTIYGLSVVDTEAVLGDLGPDLARGYAFSVVTPLSHRTTLSVVREYQQLRVAAKDADVRSRSMEGFIAAKALVRVLQGIGDPTPGRVTEALKVARSVDVGDYVLDFSDDKRAASSYVDFAMFGAGGRIFQ